MLVPITAASAWSHADAAHTKMDGHEQLCAERYKGIHDRLDVLFRVVSWGGTLAVTLLITVAGFGLKAIFDNQQTAIHDLQHIRAEVMK